jgi:hypothetical protein
VNLANTQTKIERERDPTLTEVLDLRFQILMLFTKKDDLVFSRVTIEFCSYQHSERSNFVCRKKNSTSPYKQSMKSYQWACSLMVLLQKSKRGKVSSLSPTFVNPSLIYITKARQPAKLGREKKVQIFNEENFGFLLAKGCSKIINRTINCTKKTWIMNRSKTKKNGDGTRGGEKPIGCGKGHNKNTT